MNSVAKILVQGIAGLGRTFYKYDNNFAKFQTRLAVAALKGMPRAALGMARAALMVRTAAIGAAVKTTENTQVKTTENTQGVNELAKEGLRSHSDPSAPTPVDTTGSLRSQFDKPSPPGSEDNPPEASARQNPKKATTCTPEFLTVGSGDETNNPDWQNKTCSGEKNTGYSGSEECLPLTTVLP